MKAQLSTKSDLTTMFVALENSLKTKMAIIHKDLGHLLTRVEEVEKSGLPHKYNKRPKRRNKSFKERTMRGGI